MESKVKYCLRQSCKIAVAIRTARAAAGWNQEEFAKLMGVAKTTIARIETLEMSARAEFLSKAMRLFREAGIEIDLYESDSIPIIVKAAAINRAIADLQDDSKRRVDRRGGLAILSPDNLESLPQVQGGLASLVPKIKK